VRFITSTRLKNGQVIVVSGGDGYEQFSPGTGSNLAGTNDLFHFMSYCSNLAVSILLEFLDIFSSLPFFD